MALLWSLIRRGRFWASVLTLIVGAAMLLIPLVQTVPTPGASSGPDPVTISDYAATYAVDADGTLHATEVLTTEFPAGRHGIFRFWDVRDGSDEHVRLVPRDIEVTLDGHSEPMELLWQQGSIFRVAKIGSADVTLAPGTHVYTIRYEIPGALAPTDKGGDAEDLARAAGAASVFNWDVVARGWQMPINHAVVRVTLPAAPTTPKCAVTVHDDGTSFPVPTVPAGTLPQETMGQIERQILDQVPEEFRAEVERQLREQFGPVPTPQPTAGPAAGACAVSADGKLVTISTGNLSPHTGVTLLADVPMATPDRRSVPWPAALDVALGRQLAPVVFAALLALVLLGTGFFWDLRTREREPGFPVAFAPPAGLGPAQAQYLMAENVGRHALSATLLYQAEKGLIRMEETGPKSWVLHGIAEPAAWEAVDEPTRDVGVHLGLNQPGQTFATGKSVAAGQTLKTAASILSATTAAWAVQSGVSKRAPRETASQFIVAMGAIATVVLFVFALALPFKLPYALFVVPGLALVLGGAGVFRGGVGRRRTDQGRRLWSEAGGFRRLLSTDSAKQRFDFSERQDLYTAYIPYAVAFDCADAWRKRYEQTIGADAPGPSGVQGPNGAAWVGGAGGAVSSLESSVASAIGAYTASQASSSGGGGGSSGGGGGGGGGGGSW